MRSSLRIIILSALMLAGTQAGADQNRLSAFPSGSGFMTDSPQAVNDWNLVVVQEDGSKILRIGARYGDCIGNNAASGYNDNCDMKQRFELQTRKSTKRGGSLKIAYDLRVPAAFPFYNDPVIQQVAQRRKGKHFGQMHLPCTLSDRGMFCYGKNYSDRTGSVIGSI